MAKNRNLFISHAWTYGDAYSKLVGMLDAAPRFTYSNYSIPKDDPVHDAANERQLYDAISNKIRFCDVVVIMAGGRVLNVQQFVSSKISTTTNAAITLWMATHRLQDLK